MTNATLHKVFMLLALAAVTAKAELPVEAMRQIENARAVCREMEVIVPKLEAKGGGQYSRMALEVMKWCLKGMVEEELPKGYTNRVVREAWQIDAVAGPALERAKRILSGAEKDLIVPRYRTGNALRLEGPLLVGDRTWPNGRVERNVPVLLNGWGHFGLVREQLPELNRMGYNFLQIEHGIYNFFPHKGIVLTNAIDVVREVADRAKAANSQMAFLFAPHYVPGWMYGERQPDCGDCHNGFMPICIHDPHVNSIFADYFGFVAGLLKDHPAVFSYTLTNEPHSGDVSQCRAMRKLWNAFLANKYGTVAEMNAKWKTSYASFDDVEMQKYPKVAATPAGLDFIRCDRKATADFHALIAAAAKQAAPNKPCHAKVVSNDCFYGPGFESFWSIDPMRFGEIFDLVDNDPIAFDHWDPKSFFASRWQENEAGYDYLRSFADKPVVNTENHNVVDKNMSPLSPTHVYAAFWQNVIHGQVATAFWSWERGLDDNSVMIGLSPEHPDCLEAMGRCSLDTQRLSKELAPIQAQRPTLLILSSLSTYVLGKTGGEALNAYTPLSFFGEPVGFVTEEALDRYLADGKRRSPLDSGRVIVLPSVTHLPRTSIAALRKLEAEGMKIVAVGQPLGFDDCNVAMKAPSPWTPVAEGEGEAVHAALFGLMDSWKLAERPRAYELGTRKPVYGVETRGYADKKGVRRISLCNQMRKTVTVELEKKGKDLITGRPTGKTIELPSRVPMFVEY